MARMTAGGEVVDTALLGRRSAVLALAVVAAALAACLTLPIVFSDPNGVDPHQIRIAATAFLVLMASVLDARLRRVMPIALGMVAFTVPYALWGVAMQLFEALDGVLAAHHLPLLPPNLDFFLAIIVEVIATAALAIISWRVIPTNARAALRLRVSGPAVLVTIGGIGLLVLGGLAIPAEWLARVAIQPVALFRGFLWLVLGDILQGAVQELQFRGLLMGALERSMKPWLANLLQSVIFGFAHLALVYQGPVAPFVPITMVLGFVFGWITQRVGSIWPVMVIHGVADLLVDVAIVPGLYGL